MTKIIDNKALSFMSGGMNPSAMNNFGTAASGHMNTGVTSAPAPAPVPVPNQQMKTNEPQIGQTPDDNNDRESSQDPNTMELWSSSKANRRTKERKISFVIEKVSMWRKLYNGIQDEGGKIVRYSLDDAAKKVNISKKSLDDYLLQLRYGKKYGFDFNSNKDAKIGLLRAFVKKKKADEKTNAKGKMGDNGSD
jgi:hypothetical protein